MYHYSQSSLLKAMVFFSDAPKWKFLAETENRKKRKPRPKTETETPKEIKPIISTIAFMAMTVY